MDSYNSGYNFGYGAASAVIIAIVLVFMLAGLITAIFYLLTLQRTLERVSPDLRKMSPGQVWLLLIPLFGIVWNFLMIGYIADSLRDEFRRRNLPLDEERPGYQVGLWMCILPLVGFIPILGFLANIAGLVCWIMYWVKMSRYKQRLEQSNLFPPTNIYPPNTNPVYPPQNNPYMQNPPQNPGNMYPPNDPNQGFQQ